MISWWVAQWTKSLSGTDYCFINLKHLAGLFILIRGAGVAVKEKSGSSGAPRKD
jgi:hypothetical protein